MRRIDVLPIGFVEETVLAYVARALAGAFRVRREIRPGLRLGEDSYDPRRLQHNATALLERLARERSAGADRVLGVTEADLYAAGLNFVFGQADVRSGAAVISLARLRPEFYGEPHEEGLFRLRALKEAVHEVGHTLGLGHCKSPRCVMHFSNSLADTDRKGEGFCPRCRKEAALPVESPRGE
ncbi:MAG: archaemetzincin family Zn-dependent metalloprotease [Nitrospirota bacterium]|jgi:archaemetzincin